PHRSCGGCSRGWYSAGRWSCGWCGIGRAVGRRSRASRASWRWSSCTSPSSSPRRGPNGFSRSGPETMSIAVVGVNHRTAPLEVRERFAHAPREVLAARERSETALAAGAASAPSAAVALAGKIFGRLAGRVALVLGAGDMAELAASCLVSEGVRVTLVANRTYERAQAVAEELGARALTLDEAWEHFASADIVLTSTAAPHAVVTWERVAPAIARRGGRPLCILDLAVPRDVEPAVGQLENVFLYDIDDLQAV